MVGVFVAFIRVIYGRMIFMSLPIYIDLCAIRNQYKGHYIINRNKNLQAHKMKMMC